MWDRPREEKVITSLSRENSQWSTMEIQLRFAESVSALDTITGENVSLDASIIQAKFRDCKSANNPEHKYRRRRRRRHRDRSASWAWGGRGITYVRVWFRGACAHRLPDRAANCTESDKGRIR